METWEVRITWELLTLLPEEAAPEKTWEKKSWCSADFAMAGGGHSSEKRSLGGRIPTLAPGVHFLQVSHTMGWILLPFIRLLYVADQFSSVQSLSRVRLFATPWTAACQASLSITNSWSLLKLMSTKSLMPLNHLNL